ncbi:MAG: hypothetical protein J6T97_09265 [Bacteroidaceae bacterium]|nr:hypothetical protein [Bacteroidaceae bacterium]
MKEIVNYNLGALYNDFFRRNLKSFMSHSLLGHAITNPYFLKVDDTYDECLLKGMFFGKETNCWGTEIPDEKLGPETLMELFDSFVNKGWGDDQLFWQYVSALREWSRDTMEQAICFIPNNISKVGNQGIGTERDVFDYFHLQSHLILDELSIIQPDFLIFAFGDKEYSYYIEQAIGPFDVIPTELDRVNYIRFHHSEIPSLQIDHPRYLNSSSMWDDTLAFIKEWLMKQLKERYGSANNKR